MAPIESRKLAKTNRPEATATLRMYLTRIFVKLFRKHNQSDWWKAGNPIPNTKDLHSAAEKKRKEPLMGGIISLWLNTPQRRQSSAFSWLKTNYKAWPSISMISKTEAGEKTYGLLSYQKIWRVTQQSFSRAGYPTCSGWRWKLVGWKLKELTTQ